LLSVNCMSFPKAIRERGGKESRGTTLSNMGKQEKKKPVEPEKKKGQIQEGGREKGKLKEPIR